MAIPADCLSKSHENFQIVTKALIKPLFEKLKMSNFEFQSLIISFGRAKEEASYSKRSLFKNFENRLQTNDELFSNRFVTEIKLRWLLLEL